MLLTPSLSAADKYLPTPSWPSPVESYRASGRRIVLRMGVLTFSTPDTSLTLTAPDPGRHSHIAVNSDASVSRLKGSTRPINPLSDRIQVLSGLDCVDHLVLDEDTSNLIHLVRPDVYVRVATTPKRRCLKRRW